MRYILLVLMLVPLLLLSSCGMMGGAVDFGFIKVPMIFIFAAIILYIIYRRNHR